MKLRIIQRITTFYRFWQQGNHTDKIPLQIEEIYQSGCKVVCIESRTHCDFGGEHWWNDLKLIIEECKKRNMKVWILDDSHFPIGFANGEVLKNPNLRKYFLVERHIDLIFPTPL